MNKSYECSDCGAYITSSGPLLSAFSEGCTLCGSKNVKRILKDVITPEMEKS